jgi:tetratricopeptide (TPR) repeat protein
LLADLLYRSGDLPAARERFYAALELDEEYVEARVSLGCVLAEMGELELAAAAFEGALAHHGDFADAHFHLGNALERLEKIEEAERHFRAFLELAPESPWAAAARDRLADAPAAASDQP